MYFFLFLKRILQIEGSIYNEKYFKTDSKIQESKIKEIMQSEMKIGYYTHRQYVKLWANIEVDVSLFGKYMYHCHLIELCESLSPSSETKKWQSKHKYAEVFWLIYQEKKRKKESNITNVLSVDGRYPNLRCSKNTALYSYSQIYGVSILFSIVWNM